MIDALLNDLQNAGLLELGALLIGLLRLITVIVMISGCSPRSRFVVFLALALLPLDVGAAGTALGQSVVDRAAASGGSFSQAELELGRANAAIPLEIAALLTALIVLAALIGLSMAGDSRSADGARSAH